MLFQEFNFSKILFLKKNVLEIGCNRGLTTLQISKFAKKVTAVDNDKKHIYFANKLRKKKNIKYLQVEVFDKKAMNKLGKFEIIYLREIFNFLKINEKKKIIKILQKNLKQKGKIVITDFYSKVFIRKKIISLLRLNISYLFQIDNRSKIYHFKNEKELKTFFGKLNLDLSIFKKDPLNKHVGLLQKIIEYLYPCKYTVILNKK
tara:strand:+ start:526 stop:1137 length:612 start_codon:yes stop_codon:yes gene_type:complete